MLVVGAKGHAVEILGILDDSGLTEGLCFFDDVSPEAPDSLFGKFPVLKDDEAVREHFASDPRFVLGIGSPVHRRGLAARFLDLGGELTSVTSRSASIGTYGVKMGEGVNVMDSVWVSNSVEVGEGALLNRGAGVHHESVVGAYAEVGPGALILGRVVVGEASVVGAGAIVLPDRRVGEGAVVGAGAVVTRDVPTGEQWMGVPATAGVARQERTHGQ